MMGVLGNHLKGDSRCTGNAFDQRRWPRKKERGCVCVCVRTHMYVCVCSCAYISVICALVSVSARAFEDTHVPVSGQYDLVHGCLCAVCIRAYKR